MISHLSDAGIKVEVNRVETEKDLPETLRTFAPDVVIVDPRVPGLNFESIVGIVQEIRPRTPIIVVSGKLTTADSGWYIRAGAETFISKTNLARLAPAVSAALQARSPLEKLTPRQIEVMKMVALGLRTRDIAEKLQLSVKTIESHRQEVMRRLGLRNMADLVRYAVRVGLVASAS